MRNSFFNGTNRHKLILIHTFSGSMPPGEALAHDAALTADPDPVSRRSAAMYPCRHGYFTTNASFAALSDSTIDCFLMPSSFEV